MTSRLQHLQCLITTTHQQFHHQQSKEQSRVITDQKKTKSNSCHWTIQVLNLTLNLNLNLGCRETNHYTPEYDVVWGRRDLDWMRGRDLGEANTLRKCRYQLEFSMLTISSFAALHVPPWRWLITSLGPDLGYLVAAIGCDATIFLVSWSTISSRYGNMCLIFVFNSRTPHSFYYLIN